VNVSYQTSSRPGVEPSHRRDANEPILAIAVVCTHVR
jgi:hypothetical protein